MPRNPPPPDPDFEALLALREEVLRYVYTDAPVTVRTYFTTYEEDGKRAYISFHPHYTTFSNDALTHSPGVPVAALCDRGKHPRIAAWIVEQIRTYKPQWFGTLD